MTLTHEVTFNHFIRRRFIKIYVPYIIVVFISFLLPWMYAGNDRLIALFSHLLLFKMFIPTYTGSFGVQLWFISTILQLYLLFIPMSLLKKKIPSNKTFFSIFLGISLLWWFLVWLFNLGDIRIWNSFCLQFIWEFSLGMCLAEYFYKGNQIKIKYSTLAIVAFLGLGLQSVMAMKFGSLKMFNDIPALFGYLSLAILISNIPLIKVAVCRISSFSYELYLIHILVMSTIFYILQPSTLIMQLFVGSIAITTSLVLGKAYSIFIKVLWKNYFK